MMVEMANPQQKPDPLEFVGDKPQNPRYLKDLVEHVRVEYTKPHSSGEHVVTAYQHNPLHNFEN